MPESKLKELQPLFYPRSLAVVGASNDLRKMGGTFFRAQLVFGFKGKLYPVNPGEPEVQGLKAYPSIRDLPEPVDLVSVQVPAPAVPGVLEDCLARGIKFVEITTAGFSEQDEAGRRLEAELARIARRGLRVLGPNGFGVYSPRAGITISPGAGLPREVGPVALTAQSGGIANRVAYESVGQGIRFSKIISYGNACDIAEAELYEYLAQDPDTEIIASYIEGAKQGRRWFQLLPEITRAKPVIIWKGGTTQAGVKAVSSHTGSLAGQSQVWEALFKQTGVIGVGGYDEFVDTILAFARLRRLGGRRVAVVGGGGGVSVAAADTCERAGLALAELLPSATEKLKALLPPVGSSYRNPVDVGNPGPPLKLIETTLDVVGRSPGVDAIIVDNINFSGRPEGGRGGVGSVAEAQQLLEVPLAFKRNCLTPLVVVLPRPAGGVDPEKFEAAGRQAKALYTGAGIPVYPSLERAVRALSNLASYGERHEG